MTTEKNRFCGNADHPLSPFLPSTFFPSLTDDAESDCHADDDWQGFLGLGGQLTPEWLVDAYSHGIFPWPFEDVLTKGQYHLGWFSPDPRGIFELADESQNEQGAFHVSRRLARTCRSGRFTVTSDQNFYDVIKNCALGPGREGATWITPEMIEAYMELHRLRLAHSVETWRDGKLLGGVYGVALRGLFAAESMFSLESDASKVALAALVAHLRAKNFQLLDIQIVTEHTGRLGAVEISRHDYFARLHQALQVKTEFGIVDTASLSPFSSSHSHNDD